MVTFVKVKSYYVSQLSWFCHPYFFSLKIFVLSSVWCLCDVCDVSVMLWCHSHIVIFVRLFCCVRFVLNLSKSPSVLSQVSRIYILAYFWWFTFLILQLKFSFENPRRDEIPIWESPWGSPRISSGFLELLWSPRPPVWSSPALRRKSSYNHLLLDISAWTRRHNLSLKVTILNN